MLYEILVPKTLIYFKSVFTMQDQKTQQFAKFFIKDIKIKVQKSENKKNPFNVLNVTSVN
tara:strand:- start:470 stop:649 length:180 start_codon:yes stop_codon:yes gene_type:complete